MTIAKNFAHQFELIPENYRGFKDRRLLNDFLEQCRSHAVKCVIQHPTSYKSGESFLFKDGSKLYLANYGQESFGAWVVIIDGETV